MTSPLAIQLRKEARALLPWWLGVVGATTATAILAQSGVGLGGFRHGRELWVAMPYALGVLALAALSVGHELTHGTLPALLVQPISRLRVLVTKLLILIPAVVALGLAADWWLIAPDLRSHSAARPLLVWGPVMAAVGLVPLLTLLTHKPLGGVVFSISLPGSILVVSERFYSLRDGPQVWSITWYGTLILCVLGVVALVHRFSRLEAVADGGAAVSGHRATSASASVERARAAPRNWVWLSLKKELRLQQLTFAVSGLPVLAATLVAVAQRFNPDYVGPRVYELAGFYGVFIALLAGSVASAEERHLGTLASQMLLPQAAWRQWFVKVAVTLGVAAALAAGLPALLMSILRPADPFLVKDEFVVGIVLVTSGALYISTLCSNSLWALLATLPAIGGVVVGGAVVNPVLNTLSRVFPTDSSRIRAIWQAERGTDAWAVRRAHMHTLQSIENTVPIILAVGLVLLVLYLAGRNHRSLERDTRTIANQVAGLILYVVAGTLVVFAIDRIGSEIVW